MSLYLGIDTSNYTTSAAVYSTGDKSVIQQKLPLPVKSGERGLRQSDAVFHHVSQLPDVINSLRSRIGDFEGIAAVGASTRPRNAEGSYMPCFKVGHGAARILSDTAGIRLAEFSHQEGHIAAVLYSAGKMELLGGKFIAFHLSGGTTEAVMAEGTAAGIKTTLLAGSLDLKAGQLIDRTAVMLGLPFPGGVHLEKLAAECGDEIAFKPSMKGADCSLSGVENKCAQLLEQGKPPCFIAKFCITAVVNSVTAMTEELVRQYGDLPLVYAGGVASNSALRSAVCGRFDAAFASPEFSSDNAAGIAILTALRCDC